MAPRTLHIRCGTWDQVEAFYSRKLRRGRLLSMRVPFAPAVSTELTVGLELPTHMVVSIDGIVRKCEASETDARHWIEIELVGLSDELLAGLRDMVADGSPAVAEEVPAVAPASPASSAPASPASSAPARATIPPPVGGARPTRTALAGAAGPSVAALVGAQEEQVAHVVSARPLAAGGAPLPPGASALGGSSTAPGSAASAASAASIASPRDAGGLPDDERELFATLSTELRRLRQAAVHEVLGVSRDARAEEIRDGWMAHIRRFHPDVMARHRSLAVSHLAEELTILGNRAYDRLRVALVAEGRGAAFGPALFTPHGWLVGFDDLSTSDVPAARALASSTRPPVGVMAAGGNHAGHTTSPPMGGASSPGVAAYAGGSGSTGGTGLTASPLGGGPALSSQGSGGQGDAGFESSSSVATTRSVEAFEAQARDLLSAGDAGGAREILASALVAYPRSRPLRSLYYVASALTALAAGQVVLATSQLETALAHHESCVEASLVLDQIHRNGGTDYDALRKVFQ